MQLNQIYSKGVAEIKLLDFFVEDEGCPHIFLTAHTPVQFLKDPKLISIDVINIQAKVFISGADQLAIDGFIVEISEEFNFSDFTKSVALGNSTINSYLDGFKAKLKLKLFEVAQNNNLLDELESKIFSKCMAGNININGVPVINNATRAILLIDKAMIEFRKFLEMSRQIALVDQL